jgi:hypothetical protein
MHDSPAPEDEAPLDEDTAVEQAWIAEAGRRYQGYLAGVGQSVPAAEAIARVRAGLRDRSRS